MNQTEATALVRSGGVTDFSLSFEEGMIGKLR
jgi:hypothetical protein